jgi:hypothetical protein
LPVPPALLTLPRLEDMLGCTVVAAQGALPAVSSLITTGGVTTGCAITNSSTKEPKHEPPQLIP